MRKCCLNPFLAACLVFIVCCAASAAADITTFRLKSLRGEQVFGPFEFAVGRKVFLDNDAYSIIVEDADTVKFKSLKTGETYGPYDLIAGRIVEIGEMAFVISDVLSIAAPKTAAPPPSDAAPDVKTVAPPVRAAVRTGTGTGDELSVRAVKAGTDHPRKKEPSDFFSGAVAGIEISPLGECLYDISIGEIYSDDSTAIENKSFLLLFRKEAVTCRFGAIWSGEWRESVDRALNGFENAGLEGGSGLMGSLELNREMLSDGPWGMNVSARLSYRNEDYTLVYSRLTTSLVEIPGANGISATTQTVANLMNIKEDATLTEWILKVGASISYEEPAWWCFGGLTFDLFTDTDIDAAIVSGGDEHRFNLERSSPIIVVAGIGMKAAGLDFHLEGGLGEERRFAVGVSRRL